MWVCVLEGKLQDVCNRGRFNGMCGMSVKRIDEVVCVCVRGVMNCPLQKHHEKRTHKNTHWEFNIVLHVVV